MFFGLVFVCCFKSQGAQSKFVLQPRAEKDEVMVDGNICQERKYESLGKRWSKIESGMCGHQMLSKRLGPSAALDGLKSLKCGGSDETLGKKKVFCRTSFKNYGGHSITHLCPFTSRSPPRRVGLRPPESVMLVAPIPPPRVVTRLISCVCSCLCFLNDRTTS